MRASQIVAVRVVLMAEALMAVAQAEGPLSGAVYQWGRIMEPLVQSAEPVERTFRIMK